MRWQGCVNTPGELANVITPEQVAAFDGIFYSCKSNRALYILAANSNDTPISDVVIKVGNEYGSSPGRFIKLNDVFLDYGDAGLPAFVSMGIVRSSGSIYLKIADQLILIGMWPGT
jgi:hypothetical protein